MQGLLHRSQCNSVPPSYCISAVCHVTCPPGDDHYRYLRTVRLQETKTFSLGEYFREQALFPHKGQALRPEPRICKQMVPKTWPQGTVTPDRSSTISPNVNLFFLEGVVLSLVLYVGGRSIFKG